MAITMKSVDNNTCQIDTFETHKRIMERSQTFSRKNKKSGFVELTSKDLKKLKNAGRKY